MKWFALVTLVATLGACGGHDAPAGPPARRAFYFWRTTFALTATEQRAVTDLGVARIYVRMFDLAWSAADSGATAVGKIVRGAGTTLPAGVELVPVVYLETEVIRRVPEEQLPGLARRLWADVAERAASLGFTPRELQLDCDWTDSTQAKYFRLLQSVQAAAGLPLSATIRLHQIKYRERTGVPPVDRGMLMFYNMGKFSPDPEARAIFDPVAADRYLARIGDYPLPLDVALPIWSWTVQLRDDRVVDLLQSTDPAELPGLPFLAPAGADRFVATRTAFLHGTLIEEGDVLKIEVTGPAETATAAAMLAPHLARTPPAGPARTLSLFDLSERNLQRHGPASLAQIYSAVR